MNHNELGKWGEAYAAEYLEREGFTILERNWYFDKAEIDIICERETGILVIVEVKTRNSEFFGDPQEFVSKGKIKNIVKATNEYVIANDLDVEVRFDIIAILKNKTQEKLEHFEDAFYHF
ncbi:MAG: YraN family protein [Leeuwenhoekiella sp.]